MREVAAMGGVLPELVRRDGGAFQDGALAMCCLGASRLGVGAPRSSQQGRRPNIDLLDSAFASYAIA